MSNISVETSGGWENTEEWVKRLSKAETFADLLDETGNLGEKALASATPVGATGETAKGWRHTVNDNEVNFHNVAHPQESVNVAKIIHTGHGTGTGGYVPPRPYINKAMEPVYKALSKSLDKELS